jgi:hypothetical protein
MLALIFFVVCLLTVLVGVLGLLCTHLLYKVQHVTRVQEAQTRVLNQTCVHAMYARDNAGRVMVHFLGLKELERRGGDLPYAAMLPDFKIPSGCAGLGDEFDKSRHIERLT